MRPPDTESAMRAQLPSRQSKKEQAQRPAGRTFGQTSILELRSKSPPIVSSKLDRLPSTTLRRHMLQNMGLVPSTVLRRQMVQKLGLRYGNTYVQRYLAG